MNILRSVDRETKSSVVSLVVTSEKKRAVNSMRKISQIRVHENQEYIAELKNKIHKLTKKNDDKIAKFVLNSAVVKKANSEFQEKLSHKTEQIERLGDDPDIIKITRAEKEKNEKLKKTLMDMTLHMNWLIIIYYKQFNSHK